ncbi:cytochrome c3 family protein [Desulforhopalus singaporensis]|uniref:Tetraheme cytochrome c subunit of nitrate or TMAO reductase n=1 Tax=Desulforhopalus singaporensis TaxID=91360 RepID=A0A1H0N3M9_9BACT|nr:NapC/NirT family cytochrome c [Desulforhopalus singaporensis]SDO87263.1 Tetraheme cytochrome c subunit of nitrate or TMAO reductase [Desulforhopalus singaporensis]
MQEKKMEVPPDNSSGNEYEQFTWQQKVGLSMKTPIGLFGIGSTTVCITLTVLGLLGHITGLISNPYAAIVTFLVFPAGAVFGLFLIPVSGYLRHKKWFRDNLNKGNVVIDFGKKNHRKTVLLVLVLTVVNLSVFSLVIYEAYHFTESDFFCGAICHTVMDPEYTAYQRSPHAKVGCVSCHIGSGAEWYVKAKLSGLRQVKAVLDGSYSTPIPAPVEHLRPAQDTCEECHWPEKFHGKKIKKFISYSNDDQEQPYIQEIALHIGGRNPVTDTFEGIHWHVSNNVKVQYQSLDDKRTSIGRIKVSKPSGVTEEYTIDGADDGQGGKWRTMDCIDCHNRPTHVYDTLEQKVDFGLYSKKIDGTIPGIREDSITVLEKEFTSRDEAREQIVETLLALMAKRHDADFVAEHEESLISSGKYLLDAYLANVWPQMKVTWGTYKQHLGHQYEDEGYGCFRCHDEEHQTEFGKTISQSCDLCHDEPL